MNLRTQIREAIDDVATPAPTLERRVRAFVFTDRRERTQHRAPWIVPFRGVLGFVATALVLAFVAGLFIGGRFWERQNAPPSTVGVNQLKSLEGRPLNYPIVAPGATCPVTPPHLDPQIGMVVGPGPVFVINGDIYESNEWGFWVAVAFAGRLNHPGLVLARARDLKSDAQVAFATYPLEPTPVTAVGPLLGTSHVVNHVVQMRSEAAVPDPSKWPSYPKLGSHVEVIVLLGMQKGSSGCIGLQVDAAGQDSNNEGFSENLVFQPGVPGV